MRSESPFRYTRTAKALHWIIAALIICMTLCGWALEGRDGAEYTRLLSYHVLGGFLILAFVIIRISWRLGNPPPVPPETMTKAQTLAALTVHLSLYALMFLVPLTGVVVAVAHDVEVTVAGGIDDLHEVFTFLGREEFDLKREIHAQAIYALLTLVVGHIGAGFVHQFWLKDGLLRRMLPER